MSLITFSWSRLRPTFYRRYKWAFRPAYDNIDTPVVGHPELHGLMQACSEALQVKLSVRYPHIFFFITVLTRMNNFRLLVQ